MHGEALSADQDAIAHYIPQIKQLMMGYCARDIWNADDFRLFYRQLSGWTMCKKVVAGHKKEKSRLTFLECCNADGSKKIDAFDDH